MAFTLAAVDALKNEPEHIGHTRRRIVDLVVSSYTTGGETVTATTFGLQKILGVSSLGQVNAGGAEGTVASWVKAAGKIMLMDTSTGAQTTAAAARTVRLEVIGL